MLPRRVRPGRNHLMALMLVLGLIAPWLALQPARSSAADTFAPAPLEAAPFGLNTHLATRYTDPDSMAIPAQTVADAGVGWAREDIHWYRVQPTPDTWDWNYTDNAMKALIQRGVKIVGVIGHPPGWATPYGGDQPDSFSFYPPDPMQFANFAQVVAVRYSRYIDHWEIWNEPDNPLFWRPAPDAVAYAHVLNLAGTAIHAAVPRARVILGGVNPFELGFLRTVAQAGVWDSFDIIGIHPYVDPGSPEAGNLFAAAEGVRALAQQYGEKPIWATEMGWRSRIRPGMPGRNLSEENQANYVVRANLLLWQAGVERVFWYNLKDDPDGDSYGLLRYGNGRPDYSAAMVKPSYDAFRTMSAQLGGAQFVELRDLYTRTPVIDFDQFGAWTRGDQPNGRLSPSSAMRREGRAVAELSYSFDTSANDFVVFRRNRAALIPAGSYAIGMWVYGDKSGHALKLWLRDSQGEILQFALGAVGPATWRFLQAPISGAVPAYDRITDGGNGRIDGTASLVAVVLDDAPDTARSDGMIYLDEVVALSGPEAYDLRLQNGATSIDVLWSPEPLVVSIATRSAQAQIVERDGLARTVAPENGRIVLPIGPAPTYVRHQR
ncbi:MAG TPA: hypothetical protein VFT99_02255 [Roseiflexaceae bacterium]|nr:hypothetical protein [Roseiflexaceae bacterium]